MKKLTLLSICIVAALFILGCTTPTSTVNIEVEITDNQQGEIVKILNERLLSFLEKEKCRNQKVEIKNTEGKVSISIIADTPAINKLKNNNSALLTSLLTEQGKLEILECDDNVTLGIIATCNNGNGKTGSWSSKKLFSLENNKSFLDNPCVGVALLEDTASINMWNVVSSDSKDSSFSEKFVWSKYPKKGTDSIELFAVKIPIDTSLTITNFAINDISKKHGNQGNIELTVSLKKEFTASFAKLTEANIGKYLAFIVDEKVIMVPKVNAKIEGGKFVITGNFSDEEATLLSIILRHPLSTHVIIHSIK